MATPTVMIVENEVVLSMELEEKLSGMGYSVVGRLTTGEDAIAQVDVLTPDLVLMDIRLNGNLDGVEAAENIRSRMGVPVIYLTAYTDENTLQRAKMTEPFGYLVKPYSDRELFSSIEMALYKAQMEKRLRESEARFRTLYESADDFIFVKDNTLRYTHVNPAMLHFLELKEVDMVGKTDRDLFPLEEAVHSEEIEHRVLAGQTIEVEHSIHLGNRTITCNYVRVPLRDGSGNISGLYGIGRDVTERRLRQSSKKGDIDFDSQKYSPDRYPSSAIRSTLKQVRMAGRSDSMCLFLGESGAGKDYLARYLHENSRRASGPFFSINCAALAPELAESELFGHEKGAFTGAAARKRGLVELAEGGTLLLNEIGDLSLPLQAKLLTFLDTKSFTRVGGEKSISVDARIVAATNRDLEKAVEGGLFRQDLFYRLNVVAIYVPALQDRMEDLHLLVHDILQSLASSLGIRQIPKIEPETLSLMQVHNWPGNIRELRNVLERGLITCDGHKLTAANLGLKPEQLSEGSLSEISYTIRLSDGTSLQDALREAKRFFVTEGLRRTGGKVVDAARLLGITRDSFNHLMKSLGLRRR